MNFKPNMLEFFENTIKALKKMEKNTEVFSELKNISEELEFLEKYLKTTFDSLDNNFNSYVKQVNILSELVDFQRSVTNFKTSDKIMASLFDYLHRNVRFEHGFIAIKLRDDDPDYIIVTNQPDQTDLYNTLVQLPEMALISGLVKDRDMAYLISNAQQFYGDQIQWDLLQARSLILFPIKVHGKFLGMGFLIRTKSEFEHNDLSFVNLNVGIISLLVYQHYYFSKLKSRLFKQFQLRKMLEDVKYAEYFEKGPLYIFTLDMRYIILHANTAATNSLKMGEDMIIGENFLEIIQRQFRAGFKKILDNCEEEKIEYYRAPIITGTGLSPIFEFYLSKIKLQKHFQLILVFAVDITRIYYNDMVAHRDELLGELDQLSRTLVGEFNNLLTTVLPNISLLRSALPQDDPKQRQLQAIDDAARRSAGLVKKFLNYDLEEFEASERGNLNNLLKKFIDIAKRLNPKIDFKFQLDPGLKKIDFFPLRMQQLLKILLENSILALQGIKMPEISLSTAYIHQKRNGLVGTKPFYLRSGDYAEICFRDNGCGIPQKSISQIFKPFYSTRIKNEGVGLGLFIAYNIVKDMGGQIFVESEREKFTSIYIYLPVKEVNIMEVSALETKIAADAVRKKQPTLLVVDDEYNIRSMFKEIMEMYGFKVYTAGNGKEGVDVYKKRKKEIDLVILDMVMPVMDGRTAFIEIKKINPKQKIFIISGYSQREDLDEILQKGAIGFMRKPFQVNEITQKIKELLGVKS